MQTNIESLLDEELTSITGATAGGNSATITQTGGGTNFSSITQVGENNTFTTSQTGSINTVKAYLTGHGGGGGNINLSSLFTLDTTINGVHNHTSGTGLIAYSLLPY